MRRYDFLIAGAGSAGCVVARVLAQAGYRVALIEAADPGPPGRRPAEYLRSFGTDQDWRLKTTPQTSLARRQIIQPRGRGPGGSTRINAMIWYPPRDCDLDRLQLHGGDALDRQSLADSLACVTSWVQPEAPRWLSEATRQFLQVTFPAIEAPHAFRRMTRRGRRFTAADLVLGAESNTGEAVDLVIANVRRVVFDGDRATGLEIQADGDLTATVLLADEKVVLCGGTFASPAILMRSGIGPADMLAEHRIDVRIDSPDVGSHLADHLIMPVIFRVSDRHRFPTHPSVADLARWQIASTGPLASNIAESGAIYPIPIGATHQSAHQSAGQPVEFQVHVTPTHYLTHPGQSSVAAMTLGVNLCFPQSRGTVSLDRSASLDRSVPPTFSAGHPHSIRIDPRYLSERSDIESIIAAVRQARLIARDAGLSRFVGDEIMPGIDRQSDESIERAISRFSQTLYHPVGTCRLGTDLESVVGPTGAVRGTDRLHVIDGSILPAIPSVNPNATIMMLAHRLACGLIG